MVNPEANGDPLEMIHWQYTPDYSREPVDDTGNVGILVVLEN